jgi:D-3-phosphoglycerate dehydrogenase
VSAVADPVEALILDLLAWLDERPRDYVETMAAWRTSCPRLPVWEEAVERGYVDRFVSADGAARVAASAAGRVHLAAFRPQAGR